MKETPEVDHPWTHPRFRAGGWTEYGKQAVTTWFQRLSPTGDRTPGTASPGGGVPALQGLTPLFGE